MKKVSLVIIALVCLACVFVADDSATVFVCWFGFTIAVATLAIMKLKKENPWT